MSVSSLPREGAPLAAASGRAAVGPALQAIMPLVPLGLVLVALVPRLWGIGWQLPWELHPDEGHYVWKAADMVQDGNLNPKYFRNPSLYTYLLFIQYKLLSLIAPPLGDLGATWEALRPPSLYVLIGRLTTALLGAATVAATYRLGSRLVGRPAALLGGLLLAVSFLHVRDSHFATNDVPATYFLVVSVLFSARLAGRPDGRTMSGRGRELDLLLAGLFGGLATSTKYNAGFFAAPLLLAYGLAFRRQALTARPLGALIGAGLLAGLAYLAGTPFTLLAWPTFRDDFSVQQRFARAGWEGQGSEPPPLLYLGALGQGLGWGALALAGLGLVLLARRRPAHAALLGAYPLAYLGFMFGVRLFFARFAVPVLPFVCLAAAYGAFELARLGRNAAQRSMLLSALGLIALAQPLWDDIQLQRIVGQPDTRAQAYAWLEANVPDGTKIIVDDYSVRDRRPRGDLPDRTHYDLDIVNALSERELNYYRQQGYRYAVVSSFQYQRFPGRFDTYGQLERLARPLAVFAPTADGRELPFDIEDLYAPFHDLARYERSGPTVKIYGLGSSGG